MWGTVCDDGFDDAAATVVCRQLDLPYGHAKVLSNGHFGQGSSGGPEWLNGMFCSGRERGWQECSLSELGEQLCYHGEDAAVVCSDGEYCSPEEEKLACCYPINITLCSDDVIA